MSATNAAGHEETRDEGFSLIFGRSSGLLLDDGLTGSYPVALVERDEIVETLTTDSRMKPNRSRPIP
jgi:hypothetical protein